MLQNCIRYVWLAQYLWKDLFQLCVSWKQGHLFSFYSPAGVILIPNIWATSSKDQETQEVRSGREHPWALIPAPSPPPQPPTHTTSEPTALHGQEPVAGAGVFPGLLRAGDWLPEVLTEARSTIATTSREQNTSSFSWI